MVWKGRKGEKLEQWRKQTINLPSFLEFVTSKVGDSIMYCGKLHLLMVMEIGPPSKILTICLHVSVSLGGCADTRRPALDLKVYIDEVLTGFQRFFSQVQKISVRYFKHDFIKYLFLHRWNEIHPTSTIAYHSLTSPTLTRTAPDYRYNPDAYHQTISQ